MTYGGIGSAMGSEIALPQLLLERGHETLRQLGQHFGWRNPNRRRIDRKGVAGNGIVRADDVPEAPPADPGDHGELILGPVAVKAYLTCEGGNHGPDTTRLSAASR